MGVEVPELACTTSVWQLETLVPNCHRDACCYRRHQGHTTTTVKGQGSFVVSGSGFLEDHPLEVSCIIS